ncbi:MAG: GNAT family N-acetyltransferase [Actinopolymorphaceae bacterium]
MRRDLGDGLVLRWSTASDIEAVVALVGAVFRGSDNEEPNVFLQDVVRRYMRGDYPFMGPDDFVVVEDTGRDGNNIVACTCYLREDWEFDGIPLAVGRPEIVATDPRYRNKGLIRSVLSAVHERCARDGTIVQGITGILYFYRQFDYEYAIDLGGRVTLPVALLPTRGTGPVEAGSGGEGGAEPYRLRQAVRADIGFLAESYRHQQRDSLMTCCLPDAFWRYHIDAEHESSPLLGHVRVRIIETAAGESCGFLLAPYGRSGDSYGPTMVGFRAGTNLHAVAPSLVREVRSMGEQVPAKESEKPLSNVVLDLGADHPLYRMLSPDWGPRHERPYAWYIRVPDLPLFVRTIASVLERRLAASSLAGYTGEVKLDFYRGGLRFGFEHGVLQHAEHSRFRSYDNPANGGFPPLVFLRLLFGHNSWEELRAAYPDVWVGAEIRPLIEVLFPKRASHLFAL